MERIAGIKNARLRGAKALADITTFAGTIESGATKIREKVRIMKGQLEKAVETLDECREAARRDLSGATS